MGGGLVLCPSSPIHPGISSGIPRYMYTGGGLVLCPSSPIHPGISLDIPRYMYTGRGGPCPMS